MAIIQERHQVIKFIFEGALLNLTNKDFKSAIINMFRELKEMMSKKRKEGMMTMWHKISYVKKEINITKKEFNENSGAEK